MSKYFLLIKEKIFKTDLSKRIASHAFWSLFGSILSKVLVLISAMVVARILGKEEYGSLGMIRSTVQMFVAFAGFGIGATASRFIAEYRDCNKSKLIDVYIITNSFSFGLAIIVMFLIVFFADYIATNSLNAPGLVNEIRLGGLIFFFSVLDGAQTGTLSGFEDFKSLAITNIIKGVSQLLLLIMGAYFYGLKGAVIGFGIVYTVGWVVNFIAIRKHISKINIKIRERIKYLSFADFSILWKFSLPSAISSLVMIPVFWYGKTLLVRHNGFEAMATFDVAEQWRSQILFIPAILSHIVLPILSNSKSTENSSELVKTLKINLILNVAISSFLVLLMIIFGKYIMLSYGGGFTNTIPLIMLAFTAVIISATNIINTAVMTFDKMWFAVYINIVWSLIFIFLVRYFIDNDYGENGLALATLISYCLYLVIQLFFMRYLLKININKR